eukprot:2362440-Amphidinium_carterae.1
MPERCAGNVGQAVGAAFHFLVEVSGGYDRFLWCWHCRDVLGDGCGQCLHEVTQQNLKAQLVVLGVHLQPICSASLPALALWRTENLGWLVESLEFAGWVEKHWGNFIRLCLCVLSITGDGLAIVGQESSFAGRDFVVQAATMIADGADEGGAGCGNTVELMGSRNGEELLSVNPPGARRGRKPGSKNMSAEEKEKDPKSKKGRVCRLCKNMVDLSKTPKGVYCDADTRAIGRLRALAKTKNEEKWFAETIRDDEKLKHLMDNYWEASGGRRKWEGKTPVNMKFSLTEYVEAIRTSSGYDCKRRRKMMWRKEFIAHLQKAKGGAFTLEQAQAKWDALVAAKDAADKSVKWDLEGPREDRARNDCYNELWRNTAGFWFMGISVAVVGLTWPEQVKGVLAKDMKAANKLREDLHTQMLKRAIESCVENMLTFFALLPLHDKDEPLQFEVYYAKTTDAVDSIRQEKVLEQRQKIKNPSAADMVKLRTRATTGLDQMSVGLSMADVADIRDDMARSSKDADTVFTEPALVGKSLREAFGSDSEKEEEDLESREEEDSAKKKKKQSEEEKTDVKHWDRVVQLSRTKRLLEDEVAGVEKSLQTTLQGVTEARAELSKLPPSVVGKLQDELEILTARAEVVERLQLCSADDFKVGSL